MTTLERATIIKENKHYRVTKPEVFSSLFLEGKNKFGRWCIIRSLDGLDLNEVWQRAERVSKEREQ